MTLTTRRLIAVPALAAAIALSFTGCEKKGPAEKAGEKIDRAGENVRDTLNPKGPAEKVGEKIDNAGR